ncbi:MAG: radical SAM protein [Oligoflexia bacterium]|nr:radical SAM protein [Oligoflexia bacterium]
MKITLATIHCNPDFTPLALLYLKAYLVEKKGHLESDVSILECHPATSVDEFVSDILKTKPKVVGLSCYIWNIKTLMNASCLLKKADPELKIILGGPEVGSISLDVLKKHPYIDAIVKSEGEVPLSEIIEVFKCSDDLSLVKGISYRDGDELHENMNAIIMSDLNSLPSPHNDKYGTFDKRFICLETQRGCVFKCSFCFYNKDYSIRNRRFDLTRVKAEILYWLKKDVSQIYLMDPIFNLHGERAKEILRFIIEHNTNKVQFHTEIWAEFVDEEMASLFSEANFTFIEVGLQTTDENALTTVERKLRTEPFIRGIQNLTKFNLRIEVQLIFGLPGETLESFRNSIDFAASLNPYKIVVFPLMILPGTELWRKAGALKLVYDKEPFYFLRSSPSLSQEDFKHGHQLISAMNVVGISKAIRFLTREAKISLSEMAEEWVRWQNLDAKKATDLNAADENKMAKQFVEYFCEKIISLLIFTGHL